MPSKLLNEREVADLLGIGSNTLRNWRVAHKGPGYVKVGRQVRYRPEVIDEWLAKREQNQEGAA